MNQIKGQLLAYRMSISLYSYTINLISVEENKELVVIGTSTTNEQGNFILSYTLSPQAEGGAEHRNIELPSLQLTVINNEGREVYRIEVPAEEDQRQSMIIRVPVSQIEPQDRELTELISELQLNVPPDLISKLTGRGVRNISDIRMAGGLRRMKDLELSLDNPAIRTLEAHVDLSILPSDISTNSAIIEKGFTNITSIAQTTRTAFVSALREKVSDDKATQLHEAAKAQTMYLNNMATQVAVAVANGYEMQQNTPLYEMSQMPEFQKQSTKCSCEDCQSAVSPLAYLADLLDYTTKHLLGNVWGAKMLLDLNKISGVLLQPFEALPTTCAAMNRQLRQVRICIEVLRKYLNKIKPTDAQKKKLAQAEREYLLAAYTTLLAQLSTSFEELRLTRNTGKDDSNLTKRRQTIANRLGIRTARLNALLLGGIAVNATSSSTNADYSKWSITVQGNLQKLFQTLEIDKPVFQNDAPDFQQQVLQLTEEALEKLFGLEDTRKQNLSGTLPTPKLQQWRQEYLRDQWLEQDFPSDPYQAEANELIKTADLLPIIDPDVIGPDDFRFPFAGQSPFDLWLMRRRLVDTLAADFKAAREGKSRGKNWSDVLNQVLKNKFRELEELLLHLTEGSASQKLEAKEQIGQLDFTVESFTRLATIVTKVQPGRTNPNAEPVSEEEWQDVYAILTQVEKRRLYPQWRQEEQAAGILLGPALFWPSLSEPVEGEWPPVLAEQLPLIDPEDIKPGELPDPTSGKIARDFWNVRRKQLDELSLELKEIYKQGDFEALVNKAFYDSASPDRERVDLAELYHQLNQGDAKHIEEAKGIIMSELHLSVESFTRLMSIKAKPAPAPAELAEIYAILITAYKKIHLYRNWMQEENRAGLTRSDYWKVRKAALPRWLASPESRQVWLQALAVRSQASLIDPDVINEGYFKSLSSKNAVYSTWLARKLWVTNNYRSLTIKIVDNPLSQLTGLDQAIESIVGIAATELLSLQEERDTGNNISARLAQLTLTLNAFDRLLQIRMLVAANAEVLDSEWDEVCSILLQVKKQRQFAIWREEERNQKLTLSSDHFQLPDSAPIQFPPPKPKALPAWRATWKDIRNWESKLQSRTDQDQTIVNALREAVSATEEETLIALRDALVMATDASGTTVQQKGKWITDKMLIDALNGSQQKTTRISQAIETIQSLLWSVRTGQLNDTYPDLELSAPYFDEEWKWIGSYATWRAAMFVFLYPENILTPNLRKDQTPVFESLVKSLRSNRSLTVEDAREAAKTYSDYFRDLCTLKFGTGCAGLTHYFDKDLNSYITENLNYRFAYGLNNKIYWSANFQSGIKSFQTYWSDVPGLEGLKIIELAGAVPYYLDSDKRFIYLFIRTQETEKQKLIYIKCNLKDQSWGSYSTLNVPFNFKDFEAKIRAKYKPSGEYDIEVPPILLIKTPSGILYERQLNQNGTNWSEKDWQFISSWKKWKSIGSPSVGINPISNISVVVRGSKSMNIFLKGKNGFVYSNLWNLDTDHSSTNWNSQGWFLIDDPSNGNSSSVFNSDYGNVTSIARANDHIDLFVAGSVFNSYTNWWNANADNGKWHKWSFLPGNWFGGDEFIKAVYPRKDHITLLCIGKFNALIVNWWDFNLNNGLWNGWYALEQGMKGTSIAAISSSVNIIHIFRGNGDIYHGWLNISAEIETQPGSVNWESIGKPDVELTGDLAAIAASENSIHIFGIGEDDKVYTNSWNGHWNSWVVVSNGLLKKGSKLAVSARTSNHIDIFGIGTDGRIYTSWSDKDINIGEWSDWFLVDNFSTQAMNISVVSRTPDTLSLFARGDDGNIYTTAWDAEDWSNSSGSVTIKSPSIALKVAQPFEITEKLSGSGLHQRRIIIEQAFKDNYKNGFSPDTIYLEEAFYFFPVYLALQLQSSGQYIAALDWFRTVYDYKAPLSDRKIYYGLKLEEQYDESTDRASDWLLDPLNPHEIAATRQNTYTRFTLLSIIRCLLDYADAEYTRDTAESVPRARTLYTTALELLDSNELKQKENECDQKTSELGVLMEEHSNGLSMQNQLLNRMREIDDKAILNNTIDQVKALLTIEKDPINEWQTKAWDIIHEATKDIVTNSTLSEVVSGRFEKLFKVQTSLLTQPGIAANTSNIGMVASNNYLKSNAESLDFISDQVRNRTVKSPAIRTDPTIILKQNDLIEDSLSNTTEIKSGNGLSTVSADGNGIVYTSGIFIPPYFSEFCFPPNPVVKSLRLRAELNLYKLRTNRNIAGLERQLEPYAAATDTVSGMPLIGASGQLTLSGTITLKPTPYRYTILIDRAKQLVQLAAQIESAMLSAIEKQDAEYYNVLKARQDIRVTQAGVQLQNIRVTEAENGVTLAELQEERAQIQVTHYQELIDAGISQLEQSALNLMREAQVNYNTASNYAEKSAITQGVMAGIQVGVGIATGGVSIVAGLFGGASSLPGIFSALNSKYSSRAAEKSSAASIASTNASYERRAQDWAFQQGLAQQDIAIGGQQITLAQDQVRVRGQELLISEIQAENAEDTLNFLNNKFTNAELYDWMSDVLEGVYRFFLQQATATAQLASGQLAFERQATPPGFIQADYWEMPVEGATGATNDSNMPDRRGLTGSARLLQDIYQLDQYAFETNKRKLQLTKTISLAQLDPYAFERFRETGILPFSTPMELFDRSFPGHYLRLINRVRTTVIALIPPTDGINATLTSTGLSRVVVGGDIYQTIIVRRDPESVALSSPMSASGVFELDTQAEMLYPFENIGVDTSWEFRLAKAANRFDYRTIADVLLSFEYTALNSFDYRQQVINTLDTYFSGDRAFSFRAQFADQWYDLHNPDQNASPLTVQFKTVREDFPPNLEELRIQHVLLYFIKASEETFEVPVSAFRFTEQGGANKAGGSATSIDGVISTRRGNAGSWTAMIGKSPFGEWELSLPDNQQIRKWLADDLIEDILFVITFSGLTPRWPI